MNWLHYLMEANLYLGAFYLCYCLFLNRETHYNMNRAYLLFSCLAAFILPVVQLGVLKPVALTAPVSYNPTMVQLHQIILTVPPPPPAEPAFTWDDGLIYAYLIGAGIFLLILLFKLYKLAQLAGTNNQVSDNGYNIIQLDEPNTAFSFFKYLFIGTNPQSADTIIRHELVHIRQKHSADILFIELLKVMNWFNPFIYLVQRSLRTVHEYIADEQTASSGNGALAYSSFLVENAYGLSGASVTHSFFNYNLLKKRIIMLHQKRSGKLARLKYLLTVPVCAGLLCASTLAFSKSYGWVDLAPKKPVHEGITAKKVKQLNINGSKSLKIKELTDTGKLKSSTTTRKRVRFPLPNPMPYHTEKGYAYSEAYYMDNGKMDILVTIKQKNGYYIDFDKKNLSDAEIAMLKDKYGYVFPKGAKYPHLPPPPPPAPPTVKELPPPPPAPPTIKELPPPPPASTMNKKMSYGYITSTNGQKKDTIFIKAPIHYISNVIMGISPSLGKPYFTKEMLEYPQLVYIHLDNAAFENVKPNQPIRFGDNAVYLINGKIYTNAYLQKRSAAISTESDIKTLFSAEKAVYHRPDNKEDIDKYGLIAKDGMTEFVNVRDSKL